MLSKQMVQKIMDEIEDLIYVSDVETYELLYMNKKGSKMFGIDNFRHGKCYELLQNRKEPCTFCTNALLKEDSFYTWEYMNPIVNRYYLLKDKLISWNGRRVRL